MRRLALRITLHVLLPLVVGSLIYIAFRDRDTRLVGWVPSGAVDAAQESAKRTEHHVPALLIGSLPDFAWAWSFGAALMLIWSRKANDVLAKEARPWIVGGGIVAIASEILQALHVIPGTFDFFDLASIALGYAMGAWIVHRTRSIYRLAS